MTLSQALELVPGVSAVGEGQGAAPAVRGLARGRTLILLDGARVSAERGAGATASFLDPSIFARVDVARGPGSVAYGTDAFGGVIAARTRRPVPGTGAGVRVAAAGGAGVPMARVDAELTYGYARGAVLMGARTRSFGDYRSPEGTIPHSRWRDGGLRLLWEHGAAAGHWSIGWQRDEARDVHRPRSDSGSLVATSPFERSQRLVVAFARPAAGGWRDVRVEALAGWFNAPRGAGATARAGSPPAPRSGRCRCP